MPAPSSSSFYTGSVPIDAIVEAVLAALEGQIVTSFEARVGDVVSEQGDYTATDITNVPAGSISAVTVQNAINELDSDKAASSHTHIIGDVTGLQAALDLKAPLASPALTGVPTAPTAAFGTGTTQIATCEFVSLATQSAELADGDYGDITVSSSGAALTVDNDVVTYAKMQNVSAASKLIGRGDSGAGDPQEITVGSGLSMSGTTLSSTGVAGAAGSDTQVQFNDGGSFGGDSVFVWNKTNKRLTVGHTAALTGPNSLVPGLQLHGSSIATSLIGAGEWSNNTDFGGFIFQKSRGAIGSHTVVAADDRLGGFFFCGSDGTVFRVGAEINAFVDGTPGASDMPTRLTFHTTADGAAGPTQRMQIDSAGVVTVAGMGAGFVKSDSSGNLSSASVTDAIEFVIDGGGSAITTGVKGYIEIPYACTITQATLLAEQSGSIVVDIWKDTYANYPPVNADSITASAPPTISAATKSQDGTLTGWTTSVSAGDILGFNVDSASTVELVTISLKVTRTS